MTIRGAVEATRSVGSMFALTSQGLRSDPTVRVGLRVMLQLQRIRHGLMAEEVESRLREDHRD